MIYQSKNCRYCFDIIDCRDCKYLMWTPHGKDCYDCCYNAPDGIELCYQACSSLGRRLLGTFFVWSGDSIYYSVECMNSQNLFGCVGLRQKQYCILNRQYSPQQWQQLAAQIAESLQKDGQWGEYLPPRLSWFGANQTIAQEFFPLARQTAVDRGFPWRDEAEKVALSPFDLPPATIAETDDSVLQRVFSCAVSGRAYKVTPQELRFYRNMGLPIPAFCPDERHAQRLACRNPPKLWHRRCAKTNAPIWTTHSPTSVKIVWANDVYIREREE